MAARHLFDKRLFLVDGMSHIYRAYHAIRGLSTRQGLPTNAIYGFVTMLRKLIAEENPDYLGIALDVAGPTVRHLSFEGYKASRKPMPDDLAVQMPYILRACEALRVPVLTHPEYEADDVLGTLARQAAEGGMQVVLVTIDKDMFQLVNDQIQVLDTRTMTRYDPEKVREKLGVPPEQVVELLGLWGDVSDNIPGAPGIGEKGSVALIQEFGSVLNCLANAEKVTRKTYRESLQNNRDLILKSRELVTIHTDLPLPLDLEQLVAKQPDRECCLKLFSELEFSTLIREFLPAPVVVETPYRRLATVSEWDSFVEELRNASAVHLAWVADRDDPIAARPRAVAVATPARGAALLTPQLLEQNGRILANLLQDTRLKKIVHDLKPLLIAARNAGLTVAPPVDDSMLAAYLVNPSQTNYSLEKLALEYLQVEVSADSPDLSHLCRRADVAGQLYKRLAPEISAHQMQFLHSQIEIPLIEVLADMEMVGIKVDTGLLESMSKEMEREIEQLTRRIYQLAAVEFNLNSPKQLGEILFEKMNLPSLKKTKKSKNYATGVEVLEQLAEQYELPRLILEYRAVSKLKSTYVDALPPLIHAETGRIHTSYNQMVAATGRLSSSNPNLQNIPIKSEVGRRIRRAFVPDDGFQLLSADYSQIELRVMAHLSEDPVLLEAFNRGEDIHDRTAVEVFGEQEARRRPHEARRLAKVFNYGIMYGLSAFGLARDLKIPQSEAQRFIDEYFRRYAGVKRWLDQTILEARSQGSVRTLFGRIRPIPDINARNWNLANFAERTAINAPIQGTAADLIKIAMIRIHESIRDRKLQSRIILQVHDELVFEVRLGEEQALTELVRDRMEKVFPLKVPLRVDLSVGKNWMEAK